MKYLIILLLLSTSAYAEVNVSSKYADPFVMKDGQGVSLDILDKIMSNIDETYTISMTKDPIKDIKTGKADLAIYNMSITSEREKDINFSTPYYVTNLAYAYERKKKSAFSTLLDSEFLKYLVILISAILAVALLMKIMGEMSFGDGTWFATVTSTTVGYGDKTAKSLQARLVITAWMYTSLILVSAFTATLSSSMVINYVDQNIDIEGKTIGVVQNGTGHDYVKDKDIVLYKTQHNLFEALKRKEISVIIYDKMPLRYCLSKKYAVQDIENTPQFYSIGTTNKELLEKINIEIPKIIKSNWWAINLRKYK